MRGALIGFVLLVVLGAGAYFIWNRQAELAQNPIGVTPDHIDFEPMLVGQTHTTSLHMVNRSNRSVRVNCETNCACIALGQMRWRTLDAGQSFDLPIRLRPMSAQSLAGKRIKFFTDHPDQPYGEVPLTGLVRAPCTWHPEKIQVGILTGAKKDYTAHRVEVRAGDGFRLRPVSFKVDPTGLFDARYEVLADGSLVVHTHLIEGARPKGAGVRIQHDLTLEATHKDGNSTTLTVPIRIEGVWPKKQQ